MVSREVYYKRLKRLCAGLYAATFSVLGWVLCAMTSSSPHVWWVTVPIVVFVAIVNSIAIQAWVFEGE